MRGCLRQRYRPRYGHTMRARRIFSSSQPGSKIATANVTADVVAAATTSLSSLCNNSIKDYRTDCRRCCKVNGLLKVMMFVPFVVENCAIYDAQGPHS